MKLDFSLVSVIPTYLKLAKLELMQNQLYLVGNRDTRFKDKMYDKKYSSRYRSFTGRRVQGTRHVIGNLF